MSDSEFIVIVGPSGCGKSTLLRMVAGLESISSGELFIDNQLVNSLEPKDRGIAMVFQNYALYPHMTNRDNMSYSLKINKVDKAEIKKRVEKVAEQLQLTPYLDRKPAQLSGGQRQRVAMGRAIVRQPKVFLFDEPLSNLDAKLRVEMRKQIKALQREMGVTSLYVTHDQVEAMTMADRLIVLKSGEVQQIGSPIHLYEKPKNIFVAEFIGSPAMNLLEAQSVDNKIVLAQDVYFDKPAEINVQGQIKLGIRPEHIEILPINDAQALKFTIDIIEHLGSVNLLHGRLINSNTPLIVQTSLTHSWQENQIIALRFNPQKLHFFNADTGMRLEV
ncbi:ABC transporter ATP-binding protein [Rappaport israeli]|uniref:ABC transporter ATP-binding protein n=1 Tax=Rappaport israeli TaxID=1839807 RepID=UPI0022B937D7|nr:sn-glycerol-3-phosphate ABC transporter ATP-binding protein UgpC [Rappaport israeli]